MNKLKTLIQQVTHYLSRFKKQDKKRGSPKLIKTTRKNVNILVLTGLGFLVSSELLVPCVPSHFQARSPHLKRRSKKLNPLKW